MNWFKKRAAIKGEIVYLKSVDEKQWRLQMFGRRGYVSDRYSVKEGK